MSMQFWPGKLKELTGDINCLAGPVALFYYIMQPSNEQDDNQTPPPIKAPVSVHRAFIYSACAPGWGDIYAGSRLRGYATLSVFLLWTAWFTWLLVRVIKIAVDFVFVRLEGDASVDMPDLPLLSLGISLFGMYFTWLWSLLSAVDSSSARRQQTGNVPQASVGWAIAVSWFCPGSGQLYTDDRRLGYMLFAAYLMGLVFMVPPYKEMFIDLADLAQNGNLPAHNPYAVIDIVHELVARVNYSFGKIFQDFIKYFAVAAAMAALRQGLLKSDTKWLTPSFNYGIALLGLGWLCPGAGQLLQGRYRIGWGMLAGYFGTKFLIGMLLGPNFITVDTADALAWLAVLVQIVAMIEAPLAMSGAKRTS